MKIEICRPYSWFNYERVLLSNFILGENICLMLIELKYSFFGTLRGNLVNSLVNRYFSQQCENYVCLNAYDDILITDIQ